MGEMSDSSLDQYLKELLQDEKNPLFVRILNSALNSTDILSDMESEMSRFLLEVLRNEN